jgi:hypothetical protein
MSKSLFANSKAALIFSAMTIIAAVSMVGTSENGMLPSLAERFDGKAEEQQPVAEPTPAPEASQRKTVEGWYDPPPSIFGNYPGNGVEKPVDMSKGNPAVSVAPQPSASRPQARAPAPSSAPQGPYNAMTAPLPPTAFVPD